MNDENLQALPIAHNIDGDREICLKCKKTYIQHFEGVRMGCAGCSSPYYKMDFRVFKRRYVKHAGRAEPFAFWFYE